MRPIQVSMAIALCLMADFGQAGEPAKSSISQGLPAAVQKSLTDSTAGAAAQTCTASSIGASASALGSTICSQVAGQLTGGAKVDFNGGVKQIGQAAGNQAAVQLGSAISGRVDASDNSLAGQAKVQAAQILSSQVSAQVSPGANGQTRAELGKQLRGQTTQAAGSLAASQVTNVLVPGALTSNSAMPEIFSPAASAMQQGLQQGVTAEVKRRMKVEGAQSEPGLRDSMKGAGADALSASVQQLSGLVPAAQQPLAGDLLKLGINLQRAKDPSSAGSFAPPSQSALPMGAQGMRTGMSILSNSTGQVGLGVKSEMEVGSKKFEISGSLDPASNANSENGKSVGVQIKIGGK